MTPITAMAPQLHSQASTTTQLVDVCAAGFPWQRLLRTIVFGSLIAATAIAAAQPPIHYLQRADMPPGAIGLQQLERGGPRGGYFQPVELTIPKGARIALAADGAFEQPQAGSIAAGMLIGSVYRFQVTNIEFHEDLSVYPTIEVIDRLYPPPGQATRFPIPVELTQEELEFALEGRYVTRVIYVEDPNFALAVAQTPGEQPYFEVDPKQDPLQVADRLGRPVAILRMGSRVPDLQSDEQFNYQPAPAFRYTPPAANVPRNSGVETPPAEWQGPEGAKYLRRTPLPRQ